MGKLLDITGQRFGKLVVNKYAGNKKWECICDCGNITTATGTQLRNGNRNSCGKCSKKDLTGKKFGMLTVNEYLGYKKWRCTCDCGRVKDVDTSSLINYSTTSCGCKTLPPDLTNKTFGDWKVIKYLGKGKWECKCKCGLVKNKLTSDIINYDIDKCKCRHLDIIDKKYWMWTVVGLNSDGRYKCKCECGTEDILSYTDLKYGIRKSCGCESEFGYENIKGIKFGQLEAIKYMGNSKWLCKCDCGKERVVLKYYLTNGDITDCGHVALNKRRDNALAKYWELCNNKAENPRTIYQMQCIESAESLSQCIDSNFKEAPHCYELCELLNLTPSAVLSYIHKYKLEHKITKGGTKLENDVYNYIKSIYDGKIERQAKHMAGDMEIDIYLKELNLGIEVNGNYWHSSIMKDKLYHQRKTIEAIKNKIRIIHIFEYEWNCEDTREKIKKYIESVINNNSTTVYGRECNVKKIEAKDATEFENKYHLQNHCTAQVYYGLIDKNKDIVATMSFGKPRFGSSEEWELLRYCTNGSHIHGGFAKLLKKFKDEYSPNSIVSYCDISKFNGNVYINNGFETKASNLSSPNYKWVMRYSNDRASEIKILSRYQTQKQRLIANGLGTEAQTEDEIMSSLGYLKIYDCGNLRFTWNRQADNSR